MLTLSFVAAIVRCASEYLTVGCKRLPLSAARSEQRRHVEHSTPAPSWPTELLSLRRPTNFWFFLLICGKKTRSAFWKEDPLMQRKIYTQPAEVSDRLALLGLEEGAIAEVVKRGYVQFASCTPNHPPLYPGFSAWATMVCALRECLLPAWERCDDNNYSLVVNAEGSVAIAVATGDSDTGRVDGEPTTKSSKGPATTEAVTSNQTQLELPLIFPPVLVRACPADNAERRMTWILLAHRAAGEVRCELSLPTSMGSDGRVDGWRERIILKSIQTDPEAFEVTPPAPLLPDISVDVKRRV